MEPSERDWGQKAPFWAPVVAKGIQCVQLSTCNLITNIILMDWGYLVCRGPSGSSKTFYGAQNDFVLAQKAPFRPNKRHQMILKGPKKAQ